MSVAAENNLLFGMDEILRVIPHRKPFVLIDGITEYSAGESCTSVKYVDSQDPVLQAHFPGKPMLPGVHIIENMAQTACFLLAREDAEKDRIYVLARINDANFKRVVNGGDTMETEIQVVRDFGKLRVIDGVARVDGKVCAKAELLVGVAN
jgi:3-hydroxyacyl-[acyl-carrier-protein] dehydratase